MKEGLVCKLSKNTFSNKIIKNSYEKVFIEDICKIEFYIKNIMGPYYKVEIEVLSDCVFIKKGYSLLGHTINLDTEGSEVEFIKAIDVKHMYKTLESYKLFFDEFSKVNLFECSKDVNFEGEKREVYWNLNITTILNENMNVEGNNYLSAHWDKVIGLMSDFVEDDIHRKMGII